MDFVLDYSIVSPEERINFVQKIIDENIIELEHGFESGKVARKLEKMTDYILYENKNTRSNKEQNIKEKEILMRDVDDIESKNPEKKDLVPIRNVKVTHADRIKYPELNSYGRAINYIEIVTQLADLRKFSAEYINKPKQYRDILSAKKRICRAYMNLHTNFNEEKYKSINKLFSKYDQNKAIINSIVNQCKKLYTIQAKFSNLKWMKSELHKDEIIMLKDFNGCFDFKQKIKSKPEYCFDEIFPQTFADILDFEKLDVDNVDQIYQLLKLYSFLRQFYYEQPVSDINVALNIIEQCGERCEFEPHILDILIWKIDGLKREDICERLFDKYEILVSEQYISKVTKNIIPQKILNKFIEDYEDWLYTYKIRGNWKKCSKCGEIKLAKYFGVDTRNKSGLKSICKKCDNLSKNYTNNGCLFLCSRHNG